ncbi:MAG: trigger factor [Hyphomicrobiales bacterium]|nr:trigger factor [Hyphomicrobiales bacterium]
MEVTESISDGLKRELKVVVAANELNQRLSDKLNEIKGDVRLKGFRPGKVPIDHIKKVYGRSVMAEIVQQTVSETSQKAVADREERPAVQPEVSLGEDQEEIEKIIEGKADLAYTLSFEVLPEIKLTDLAKLKLEKPVTEVSKQEVDDAIQRLVDESATYNEKAGAAADGDQITVDFEGTIDGLKFDGGKAEDAPIVLGSKQFIPGFEEGLIGAKAGDQKTIKVTFPDDYAAEHLAGKDAVFDVTVKKVGSPEKPKLDDKFASGLGFDSVDKLRETVEQRLDDEYKSMSRLQAKSALLDALDEKHKFELPQVLVDQEFDAIWKRITSELEQAGRTFEDEDTTEEEADKKYREIAERRVRLGLVLAEIGTGVDIEISDDEVNKALMERVRQFPGQEQQVYEFYQKNPDAITDLRAPIFEEKVVDYVLELADVKEKKVAKEDLFADPGDDDET